MVVKTPVDSTTYSAPASAHLMLLGSRLRIDEILRAVLQDQFLLFSKEACIEKYLLLEDGDGIPVNHKFPILSLDSAPEVAMSRVIFEHVNLARRMGKEGQTSWLQSPHPLLCLCHNLSSPPSQ